MPSAWLLSTLEAYFEGKKELFEGLEIEKLETDLTPYPILHIDLNTQKHDTPESLEKILDEQRPHKPRAEDQGAHLRHGRSSLTERPRKPYAKSTKRATPRHSWPTDGRSSRLP